MLSAQALLDIEDEAEEEEEQLEEDVDTWRDELGQAAAAAKQTLKGLSDLALLPDIPEVTLVALLLSDVDTPWTPPAELEKVVEEDVQYQGQPRTLVVVRLEDVGEQARTGAAQLQRIAALLRVTAAGYGRGAPPIVWPLRDKETAQLIGAKVLWAEDRRSCLGLLACPLGWRRCLGDVDADKRTSEVVRVAARHYGGAVAFAFAWTGHYARSLWVFIAMLVPLAGALAILLRNGRTSVVLTEASLGSAEHVLWESIKLVSVVWMLLVSVEWTCPDLDGGMPEESELPVEGWAARWGDKVHRTLTVLCVLPVMAILLAIAILLFTFVFWLEQYMAYEWGDCVNLGCRDPEEKWGFLGWLVGITPGILEAILFVLFSEVASLFTDLLLWIRNFRLCGEKMMFRSVSMVTMEAIGKLGTFSILAMIFVPEWDDESTLSGLPANFSSLSATEQRIARNGVDCSDLPDVAILGRGALLCLRRRLDPDYRRWLFQKSMKGPFVVAPFIAILIKVLLPILLQKGERWLRYWDRKQRRGEAPCCCGCISLVAKFIVRTAGLIFAFRCGNVGCLKFLVSGNPFSHPAGRAAAAEKPGPTAGGGSGKGAKDVGSQDADPGADATAEDAKVAAVKRGRARKLVRQAEKQMLRKEFNPDNIVLDVLLSIQWVGFFAAVWPWGCLPTLLAWLLMTRSTWALLLMSKRRPFPELPRRLQRVGRHFIVVMAHLAALWHVALSVVTYNARLSTTSGGVIAGLVLGLWAAVVLAMWLFVLAAHLAVFRYLRPADADPGQQSAASPDPGKPSAASSDLLGQSSAASV